MAEAKGKGDKAKSEAKPKVKDQAKDKDKDKEKAKKPKAETVVEAAPAPTPPVPRAPADPRLKVMKKFEGRFLPKGPLRDRYKSIRQRWESDPDHGGVTVEELKSLLEDWRATQRKPSKAAKT
jgi:hypothetical protein